jgi:hypothetical protein
MAKKPAAAAEGPQPIICEAPAWGYRLADSGETESRIFEDGILPVGWSDTPAGLKEAAEAAAAADADESDEEPQG